MAIRWFWRFESPGPRDQLRLVEPPPPALAERLKAYKAMKAALAKIQRKSKP